MVPIGVLVLSVVEGLITVLNEKVNRGWISEVVLLPEVSGNVIFGLIDIDSSVELVHADQPRHLALVRPLKWLEYLPFCKFF